MLQLVRISGALPETFAELAGAARAEGHRHMDRLADEIASGSPTFTALLAAYEDGRLVGIGGLTPEPDAHPGEAWRVRRLYVRPDARRRGVATAIANALLTEGMHLTRLVTVHAGSSEAARFWRALGWKKVRDRAWNHQFLAD